MSTLTPEAQARQDAARVKGRFGAQNLTEPEDGLVNIHLTEMAEGATRAMPLEADGERYWYDEESLALAAAAAERNNVRGMVTRVTLPDGTFDPAARYLVTLRSDRTGDVGVIFVYETGSQEFEKQTPSITEVLADAAGSANEQTGKTGGDPETALDKLIRVLGEDDARDQLAQAYLVNGPAVRDLYDDKYTVRHPAGPTITGLSLADAKERRELWAAGPAQHEAVEVINERTLDRVS